jgi:hypothetical protein
VLSTGGKLNPYCRNDHGDGLTSRRYKWLATALLAYFGLRLIYFATSVSPYIPPDEVTHFGVCTIFSKVLLLPDNTPDSYQYGLVTNIPWLYYWIMGKLLHFNFFSIPDLVFLRLLNIPLAFATVYYVRRLLRLITDDGLAELLVIVAMTNTLMFSFLSASVSYDNLANLLAAMSFYYLLVFFRNRSGTSLAISCISVLAGCLTKITFLPLVPLLTLLFVVREFRNIGSLASKMVDSVKASRRVRILLLGIFVGMILNIQLFGGNYLKYETINPAVETVLPLENAMQYRLTARGHILKLFRLGQINIEQARQMASRIMHTGDREDTINLVENYSNAHKAGFKPLGPAPYTAMWILQMLSTSFGIKAHVGMPNQGYSFIPLTLLILVVLLAYLVRWRPWDMEWFPTSLLGVSIGYATFLIVRINYPNYLDSTDIILTVAGRYIFPVMGPVYVVSCIYLMRLFKNEKMRMLLFSCAALVLIGSDFPFFLASVTPEWFVW